MIRGRHACLTLILPGKALSSPPPTELASPRKKKIRPKFIQNQDRQPALQVARCRGTEEEHGGLPERGGSLAKGSRDIRHSPLDGNPLAARAAGPEGGPHDDEERGVSERVSLRFTRGSAPPYERGPAQSPAGHLVLTPPPLALSQVLGGKPVSGPGASGDRGTSFGLFLECSSSTSTSLTLPLPRANASRASSERSGALGWHQRPSAGAGQDTRCLRPVESEREGEARLAFSWKGASRRSIRDELRGFLRCSDPNPSPSHSHSSLAHD